MAFYLVLRQKRMLDSLRGQIKIPSVCVPQTKQPTGLGNLHRTLESKAHIHLVPFDMIIFKGRFTKGVLVQKSYLLIGTA